ncbi:MAG: trigger factor [Gammaproteobacteria bacterium]|nr:trigger factor [Gammaproteobacteria bacterium]MCP5135945.1 trigger factor [Gammaproteobacteria bacterium]
MRVSVETTEGLQRRMTVEVPAERVDGEVESRIKQYARRVRLDGFRPGKVPVKLVKKQFGDSIRQEVLGEVIESTLREAFQQENVNPAGMPSVESVKDQIGEDFSYAAIFEVYPEITVGDLSALSVTQTMAEVTDADIDAMLEKLRSQQAGWEEVEREAAKGDRMVIDYQGKLADGADFPGNKRDDAQLVLGGGNLGDDFETQLVGAKAGDSRSFDVTFPEDFRIDEMAGKTAHFEVSVKKVFGETLPEMNDDFATSLGIEEGGVDALRAQVRENMERELGQKLRGMLKDSVMNAVLEANPVDLPSAMVAEEAKRLQQQMIEQLTSTTHGKAPELPVSLFEDQAKRRVSLGLLLGEVIKTNEITADEAKVRALIEGFAESYEDPQEVIDTYYQHSEMLAQVESLAMEDQVVDLILGQCQVGEEASNFDAVMNPTRNEG